MENRVDLLEDKKQEIFSLASAACITHCETNQHSSEIMQSLIESGALIITAPQQEPPVIQMITMDSLKNFSRGQSIKPGNITLNIRLLIDSMPEMIAAGVGIALDIPILKVCAALNIWKMLRKITTIEINKEQAITIISLWNNCDKHNRIALEKGFHCFNSLYKQVESTEGSWELYIKTIGELEKIHSIILDDNGIWLREWVSGKYTK